MMDERELEVVRSLIKFVETVETNDSEYGCGMSERQFAERYPGIVKARQEHEALIAKAKALVGDDA